MKKIILFTRKYPFGVHETFIKEELLALSKEFDTVLIFPNQIGPTVRDVPNNVVVDTTLSLIDMGRVRFLLKTLGYFSPRLFFNEITKNEQFTLSPKAVWRILTNLEEASRVRCYLGRLDKMGELDLGNMIFYSYWLGGQSLGLSLSKKKYPELVYVSRVHGGDLYEERHHPPYLPFRKEMYRNANRIFLISQDGYDYLGKKYNEMNIPCSVARLGVTDPGFTAVGSHDGILRIASTSALKKVKRIDLLIEALIEFTHLYPDQLIQWHHIGSGPLQEQLQNLAHAKLGDLINWRFLGQLTHEQVMDYYRTNPVDILINVSSSEGIPVSIMEAQSCGIPVIATAVGGTPEIVNDHNGRLLDADPNPKEIALAIGEMMTDLDDKKTSSRKQWEENFNAKKNYQTFVKELVSLLG